jgi:phage baseplate assembly protein W
MVWSKVSDRFAAEIGALVRYHSEPVSPYGWGSDLDCADDLTENVAEIPKDDMRLVVQSCYRRLTTRRGTLIDDPDYGFDVLHLLHAGMTKTDLIRIAGQVESELSKDDRLETVECKVSYADETIELDIKGMTRIGTFSMTMGVTEASTYLLSPELSQQ